SLLIPARSAMRAMVVPSGPSSANSAVAASLRRRRVPSVSQAMPGILRQTNYNVAVGQLSALLSNYNHNVGDGEMDMADSVPGGALKLADDLVLSRMCFGAMQPGGAGVFCAPRDRDQALAILREAVTAGVTHIDTSDFYGPVVVNELITEALHPYPADLRIVTKQGARRGEDGSWRSSLDPADLKAQVRENLAHLGVDALDVVNLRLRAEGTGREPVAFPCGAPPDPQRESLA